VATVPVGGTTGNVVVTVGGQASNGVKFTILVPTISSLSPASAAIGASVTIKGTNFGATQSEYTSSVTFNGASVLPTQITSWSNTSIVVAVPAQATTGNVVVTLSQVASNGVAFTVLAPTISSLSPTSGAISSTVTIRGTNFGPAYSQYSTTVSFNGAGVLPSQIASWSNTSIVVAVPPGATTGNVVVNQGGQVSNGVLFTVLAPIIGSLPPISGVRVSSLASTSTNFGQNRSHHSSTMAFNGTAAPWITHWSNAPPNAAGSKSFFEGSNLLAANSIFASGEVSDSTACLLPSAHRISAIYAGAPNFASRRDSVNTTLFQ
jgi:hypothetical protein